METNKPNTIERRFIYNDITEFQTRSTDDGKTIVRGYAAKFNVLSEDLGGFREQIDPAFFNGVLEDDVRVLFNHDGNLILGRTSSKTGKIGVDTVGLWFEYEDPDTSYSLDLIKSMQRGDVNQCSFAFSLNYNIQADKWEKQGDGTYIRTLLVCDRLYDTSPVTYPAYPDTEVGLRGLEAARKSETPTPPTPPQTDYKRSVSRVKLYS